MMNQRKPSFRGVFRDTQAGHAFWLSLFLFTLALLWLPSAEATEQPGSDADLPEEESRILGELQKNAPADALTGQTLAVFPRSLFSGSTGEDELDLSQYLLLGHQNRFYLMGREQKTIWSLEPGGGKPEIAFRDSHPGMLNFSDFALLKGDLLAVADQQRQAVFLFKQRRFAKALGLLDDRWLFPCPQGVFTNPENSHIGVIDSARNRGFIFSPLGQLLAEIPGPMEPCFYQNGLVKIQMAGNTIQASVIRPDLRQETLFSSQTPQGLLTLDTQAIGMIGSSLVIVCRQGVGDEDHPFWSRVLVFRQGAVRQHSILPHLRLDSGSPKPYALMEIDSRQYLLDLEKHPDGIAIRGFLLP